MILLMRVLPIDRVGISAKCSIAVQHGMPSVPTWSMIKNDLMFLELGVTARLMSMAYGGAVHGRGRLVPRRRAAALSADPVRGTNPYNRVYALQPDGTRIAALAGGNETATAHEWDNAPHA